MGPPRPQNKECEIQISGKYAPGPSSVLLLGLPAIVIVLVIVIVTVFEAPAASAEIHSTNVYPCLILVLDVWGRHGKG